jgi:uncharacterized membrane protein
MMFDLEDNTSFSYGSAVASQTGGDPRFFVNGDNQASSYNDLQSKSGASISPLTNSVNPKDKQVIKWKQAFQNGVKGFAVGAVYGGYTGATAGTFTVPVLGTAVGLVGGAVYGGAWGFATGVAGSIVDDLLDEYFWHNNN